MTTAAQIATRLAALGAIAIDPPVLQPAELYVQLGGEALRGRALIVTDGLGEDHVLRLDMTAPAVRAALALPAPCWGAESFWVTYDGPVFRREEGQSAAEFRQLGAERFSPRAADPEEDAAIIAAAIEAVRAAGVEPALRLGDVALFAAAAQSLALPNGWSERVTRAFASPGGPMAALAQAERADEPPLGALDEAIALLAPAEAAAAVARLWAQQGLSAIGGRSAADVAAGLREKVLRRSASRPSAEQIAALRATLAISGAPEDALRAVEKIAPKAAPLKEAVAQARARLAALAKLTRMPQAATLSPGFGRGLAYYDGAAFELEAAGIRLGGGGRYDGLLHEIARRERPEQTHVAQWGAAGFGLRPDRVAQAREAQP